MKKLIMKHMPKLTYMMLFGISLGKISSLFGGIGVNSCFHFHQSKAPKQ